MSAPRRVWSRPDQAALDLPAGSYLLIGTGQVLNQEQAPETVSCDVYDSTGEFLGAATTSVPSALPVGTIVDQS